MLSEKNWKKGILLTCSGLVWKTLLVKQFPASRDILCDKWTTSKQFMKLITAGMSSHSFLVAVGRTFPLLLSRLFVMLPRLTYRVFPLSVFTHRTRDFVHLYPRGNWACFGKFTDISCSIVEQRNSWDNTKRLISLLHYMYKPSQSNQCNGKYKFVDIWDAQSYTEFLVPMMWDCYLSPLYYLAVA